MKWRGGATPWKTRRLRIFLTIDLIFFAKPRNTMIPIFWKNSRSGVFAVQLRPTKVSFEWNQRCETRDLKPLPIAPKESTAAPIKVKSTANGEERHSYLVAFRLSACVQRAAVPRAVVAWWEGAVAVGNVRSIAADLLRDAW